MLTARGSAEQSSSEQSSHTGITPEDCESEQTGPPGGHQAQHVGSAAMADAAELEQDAIDAQWHAAQKTAAEIVLSVLTEIKQPAHELSVDIATIRRIYKDLPMIHSLLVSNILTGNRRWYVFRDVIYWMEQICALMVSSDSFRRHANNLRALEIQRELKAKSEVRRYRRLRTKTRCVGPPWPSDTHHEIFDGLTPQAVRSNTWRVRRAETKQLFLSEERLAITHIAAWCEEKVAELLNKIRGCSPTCEELLCSMITLRSELLSQEN